MKLIKLWPTLILFFALALHAQSPDNTHIPMLGDRAPSFTVETTQGLINFPDDYLGKWKILFSHPADFTPVCSSEILDLAEMQDDFQKLNTEIFVLSADGLNSHLQWIRSLEGIQANEGEVHHIDFPMIPDIGLEIAGKYGMVHPGKSINKTMRGVFIINPENKIDAIFFYPISTGRNLQEIKRCLLALQETYDHDVLTPSNWEPGDDFLVKGPSSKEEAAKLAKKKDADLYSKEWYLWYKKSK